MSAPDLAGSTRFSPDRGPKGEGLGCVDFDSALVRTVTPRPEDIDELGHVNNVVYVRWIQDIGVAHWRRIAPQALQDRDIWIALRHEIDYREPILPGETAEIRTWLGAAKGPRFARHVDIRKPGCPRFSASSVTQWCRLDRASGRPKRIDAEIFETFGVPDSG